MLELRVSYKTWGSFKDTQWIHCGALQWWKASSLIPSCAALVPQWGEKREKGRILTNASRCNLGISSLFLPQPLIKASHRSSMDLSLLLPRSSPSTHPCLCFPVPMLLHAKRDFMSTSLLHWHRDRPREAEKIIVITQIILSKCPRFLIVRGAGSWTSHFQFACTSIRIRHEASAGF